VNHSARNSSSSKSGEFGQRKNQSGEEAKEELEEAKEEDAINQINNRDSPSEENNFIMDATVERHEQPEQLQRSSGGASEAS